MSLRSLAIPLAGCALVALSSSALAQPARSLPSAAACALLDTPARFAMDGLLFALATGCNRPDVLAGPEAPEVIGRPGEGSTVPDVQVNDSTGESGSSTTQSETSLAVSGATGTLCSGWNDSFEFFGNGCGFTGFGRSTDGGTTWADQGGVGGVANCDHFGDPSVLWRDSDDDFYYAALSGGGGLNVYRSTDDCTSFGFLSTPTSTGGDDKEILTVDNHAGSPFSGRMYVAWTNFTIATGGAIQVKSSDDGTSWSSAVTLDSTTFPVVAQSAWPVVAPDGNVYVAWLHYDNFTSGPIDIRVSRSTDGGASFTPVTDPLTNGVSPRQAAASAACGRPALNGNIRYLAGPQLAVTPSLVDGGTPVLHVVYSYDPDGFNVGDVVNVYYRRSTDNGANWSTELQLNEVGTNDQYFPTIAAEGQTLIASWYDRQYDAGNLLQDYQRRLSNDAGVNWQASERVTDVSSPIRIDPSLAACYHGDYDYSLITPAGGQHVQWADDRNLCCVPERNDPDVWTESGNTIFADGFESGDTSAWSSVAL
jgi:hypothetical protein